MISNLLYLDRTRDTRKFNKEGEYWFCYFNHHLGGEVVGPEEEIKLIAQISNVIGIKYRLNEPKKVLDTRKEKVYYNWFVATEEEFKDLYNLYITIKNDDQRTTQPTDKSS